ncbi:hypothetical protein, partial [Kaistia hirudinis]|uniref:hypothetical protein n=1 Tax=Kaistia hirudinis TaxID=1293440 RepID=UPI0035E9BAF6
LLAAVIRLTIGNIKLGTMALTHCHTIGASDTFLSRLQGALAFTVVWGLGQFVGPLSPLLLGVAAFYLPSWLVLILISSVAYPFLVPNEALYSPRFCRFVLSKAGWLKGGSTLWASEDVLKLKDRVNESIMVCYHPHGLIPCGFSLNGAVRARAQDNATYLPPWLPLNASVSGVQAPVLFKIPVLRHILLAFGCCVPATKEGVHHLLSTRTTFGIIPGGSEEVALHQNGRENLYLKKRAGFLKYALQHGYTLVIAFTFGESDLYKSVSALRPLNLWLVKTFGFVLPIFWGTWFFPLLPRRDVPLHTVFGKALHLPKIENPTAAQVAEWHATYMRELEDLFDRHKG